MTWNAGITNSILVARDGEEALSWLTRWEAGEAIPAVILLDLKIPKIHGLEVLRRIKSHPVFMTIPIVVLTTSLEKKDVNLAYQLGANSYILKPMNFDKFLELISEIESYWLVINVTPRQGGI